MLVSKLETPLKPRDLRLMGIFLNFSSDDKHGCSKNCSFCVFKNKPQYMCPTVEDVNDFLFQYSQNNLAKSVVLSGGGDPLYNFEQNKDKVLAIINCIKKFEYQIIVQSYELDIIDKYCDSLLKDVSYYIFSTEVCDPKLIALADKLLSMGKTVVMEKVFNFDTTWGAADLEAAKNWIYYYEKHSSKLNIHENYLYCLTAEENKKLYIYFAHYFERQVNYLMHQNCRTRYLVLINNEVWAPYDYIHKVLLNDFDEIEAKFKADPNKALMN